jgi:hypothetical protein
LTSEKDLMRYNLQKNQDRKTPYPKDQKYVLAKL